MVAIKVIILSTFIIVYVQRADADTSLSTVVMTTSSTPMPTTIQMRTFDCASDFCKIDDNYYATNTSFCSPASTSSVDVSTRLINTTSPFTLDVFADAGSALSAKEEFVCQWRIAAPFQDHLKRTIIVLSLETFVSAEQAPDGANLTMDFTEEDQLRDR